MNKPDPLDGLTRDAVRALVGPEMRTMAVPMTDLAWRESDSGDGSRVLSGYAAVFGQVTTLYKGAGYQIDEVVLSGAFDEVLASNPDVHLNIGHDMNRAIARTGISGVGGLQLSADAHGLRVYARVSGDDPDVQALAAKMSLGIMDQMSFAFRIGEQTCLSSTDETGFETDLWTICTVSNLYDTCVCAQGAYPTTEAALRSLALSGIGAHVANREVAQGDDGAQADPAVASDAGGAQADPAVIRQRAVWIAESTVAASKFRPRKD
jgi:HK97 family phage prohead protease